MTEVASLLVLFLTLATARNHTEASEESKERVEQVACCFWREKFGSHRQNERGHCYGKTENSYLPTYLDAFFSHNHEGEVEPP